MRAVAALTDQHELAGSDGGVNQFHDFTENDLQVCMINDIHRRHSVSM